MNKETTFVYPGMPLYDILFNSCANYAHGYGENAFEYTYDLHCAQATIIARLIIRTGLMAGTYAYEILDHSVRPL